MASPPSFRSAPPGQQVPPADSSATLHSGMAPAAGAELVEPPAHRSARHLFSAPPVVGHSAARSGQERAARVQGDATAASPAATVPWAPPLGLDVLVAAAEQPVARTQPSA
jgi:hypothetical protein